MSPAPRKDFRDGFCDNLEPLAPIDVVANGTVSELLHAFANTAFGGRQMGEGADTLETMIRDPECLVVLTVSGAMTVAKQSLLMCELIDRGWVQAVIATGALMAHGFVEASGMNHFKHDPRFNDSDLLARGYDRVYDTLELEKNLDDAEVIFREVMKKIPDGTTVHSEYILRELGRHLDEITKPEQRSVLKSAYRHNVPIFVPAFTDSEMGLDFALSNFVRVHSGGKRLTFDPYFDLDSYARLVSVQKHTGIFTIGGGVPRNWAQQAGPFLDLVEKRLGIPASGFRFRYGVRVCPEPVHWGGLSGCSYSEGISWGKFVPPAEGGRFNEIFADATIVWPFLVRALIERLGDEPLAKRLVPKPGPGETPFSLG